METVLIAGVESVIGANLAAAFADECDTVGLTALTPFSLAGCETAHCPDHEFDTVRQWIASIRPTHIIYCGKAARSSWQTPERGAHEIEPLAAPRNWACAAREARCDFSFISSDAVFTGPWMFHAEESTCLCSSEQAKAIRQMERAAIQSCPDALIVRTNAFGWSPEAAGPGWLEQTVNDLEYNAAGPFDFLRHATPILASDLARVLSKLWAERRGGFFHVAGTERINPNQFVRRLAGHFGLPEPLPVQGNSLIERPQGFGRGETSLQTTKIRRLLGESMPMLDESLQRLREQKHNGYCDRLAAVEDESYVKVA